MLGSVSWSCGTTILPSMTLPIRPAELTACGLAVRAGTVGRSVFGEIHVLDDAMREVRAGQTGKLWFKTASPFEYFNDPVRTAEVNSPDGAMSTLGDIGHVDEEGYVYLTDRATFMIISGGVNIYPQECENLLVSHSCVADAAVFGVPNEDLGEEVKAVVQLMPGVEEGPGIAGELIGTTIDWPPPGVVMVW